MRISKKAEYAMRAVVAVAKSPDGKPVPLAELSHSEDISQRFLEQIVLILRRGGILESRRGSFGGYLLGKPASTISLADILELVDGPIDLVEGDSLSATGLGEFFAEVQADFSARFHAATIEDILAREARTGETLAFEI